MHRSTILYRHHRHRPVLSVAKDQGDPISPRKEKWVARMKRAMTFFVMVAASSPALAEDPGDAVAGHPGVTYAMLLKQIAPSLAKDANNVWTLSGIKHFRGMAPSKDPLSEAVSFSGLSVMRVREDGHSRLLLFSGDSAGDGGFDTLLAAYDDGVKVPRLIDYMNVGGDRFNDIEHKMPLSANTDMFLVSSSHDNSNQSYELDTPMFLRGGKFQTITTLFAFGNAFCRYKETQSPAYTTKPGSPYYALNISVTVEVTRYDETDCGDEKKPPMAGKKIVSDLYRWNGKDFVPTTKAVERLSDANWKSNNEP
jgi:hypothetical protein